MGGCFAAIGHLPAFVKNTNYAMPNSATEGPFQSAYNTNLNFFQYLQANSSGKLHRRGCSLLRLGLASTSQPRGLGCTRSRPSDKVRKGIFAELYQPG
jgi:hypothetical protein